MNQLFWHIYRIPVPAVLPLIFAAAVIWGLLMRLSSRRSAKAVRAVNCAVALAALVGIFYITVFRNNPGKQELILTPFQSFVEAKEQKEMYREMLMNVLLFVPFGLSVPFVLTPAAGGTRRARIRYAAVTVGIAVVISVGIEAVQYCFVLGRCETDDVLANALGALLGVCAYMLHLIPIKAKREP